MGYKIVTISIKMDYANISNSHIISTEIQILKRLIYTNIYVRFQKLKRALKGKDTI